VLDLLALQNPDGGFPLAQVAELARLPLPALAAAARRVSVTTPDGERLVATVVALALLRVRFAGNAELWAPLVRKSERWLAGTLAATPDVIDGQLLEDWATQLVASTAPAP
jgi:hypothetical protein